MWSPDLSGKFSISMKEVLDLTRKTDFFEGWFLFKSSDLGLVLGIQNCRIVASGAKGITLRVRKF